MVTTEDVAAEVGNAITAVHGWMDRLGIKSHQDWAEREVVEEKDAKRILDAIRDARLESAELHEAHERYLNEWRTQQHAAGEKAFEEYLVDATKQQRASANPDTLASRGYAFYGGLDSLALPVGPGPYTQANNAAAAARAEFEKKNPPQSFEQFEKQWKKRR